MAMTLRDLSNMVYDAMEELGLNPEGDPENMELVEVVSQTINGTNYITLIHDGDEVSIPLSPDILDLPVLH